MKTQPPTQPPIFSHEGIQALLKEHSNYVFSLEGIALPIQVKIYQAVDGGAITLRQSHFIKTPLQMTPHQSNSPADATDVRCLNKALSDLAMHHHDAVAAGYKPSKEWLIPNPDFV